MWHLYKVSISLTTCMKRSPCAKAVTNTLKNRLRKITLLLILLGVMAGAAGNAATVTDELRGRLETSLYRDPNIPWLVAGEPIRAREALPAFYEARFYEPAWVTRPTSAMTEDLLLAIRESARHGLDSGDYHLETILELWTARAKRNARDLADLDFLLTDAFLVLGTHLVAGRVNPESFDPEWRAVRREVDLVQALNTAIRSGQPRQVLNSLAPSHPDYGLLLSALEAYRGFQPWIAVPEDGKRIEPDDPRWPMVLARLEATGDLPEGAESTDIETALEAVKRFQRRHGLGDDGVVGVKTQKAMNVPLAERIRQLELNLERWRWMPQEFGERFVLVDIPAFSLKVVERGVTVFESRVVVGRNYRRTPVMTDTIRYLVLNPYWEVPPTLALQDKLPEIRKDLTYLERNGFQVFQGWGSEQQEIDPSTVDWQALGPKQFPYRLRQAPGPLNALGRIKFMFPNKFNVYLHDTPSRELFRRPERAASSGCIRVEKPVELAAVLLAGSTDGTVEALERLLAREQNFTVPIRETWPVHLQYWTAAIDESGRLGFRTDIYDRDRALAEALSLPPTGDTP